MGFRGELGRYLPEFRDRSDVKCNISPSVPVYHDGSHCKTFPDKSIQRV